MRHKRFRTSPRVHPWQVLCLTRDRYRHGKPLKTACATKETPLCYLPAEETRGEDIPVWPLFLVYLNTSRSWSPAAEQDGQTSFSRPGAGGRSQVKFSTQPGCPWKVPRSPCSLLCSTHLTVSLHIMTQAQP